MTKLYVLSQEEINTLEIIMENVGTVHLPYLPSQIWFIEDALKDAYACDFRKKAAQLSGHIQKLWYLPTLDDAEGMICSCGGEACTTMNNGECFACHVGMTDILEEEHGAMTYDCRHCQTELKVFTPCPCGVAPSIKAMEHFWEKVSAPSSTRESYEFHFVYGRASDEPTRIFNSEYAASEFIMNYRNGSGTGITHDLHRISEMTFAYGDVDDNQSQDGIYVEGVEIDGVVRWYWTYQDIECSILFETLREAILHLDTRLEEIQVEAENAYYAERDEVYEEGPYGGAFASQEDYEDYRFGGISYLNSI